MSEAETKPRQAPKDGEPIQYRKEPRWGIHDEVEFYEYLIWDAWGSGELRGAVNPAKLRYERLSGKDVNSAMITGRATHACVLEPDTEWLRYVRMPDGVDRRHKAYKEMVVEHGADYVLRSKEYDAAVGIRDSLFSHTRIKRLLKEGRPEVSFAWKDPETGLPLKGRSDWLNESLSTTFDLKTTGDASERAFARIARDFGYPEQAVHYTTGLTECGLETKHYTIIAAESDPPYLPILYSVSTKDLMIAGERWRTLVDRLSMCVEDDDWPGYPEHTHVLHMGPYWEADVQADIAIMREEMAGR